METFLARLQAGERHLKQVDPLLGKAIEKLGPHDWQDYQQIPLHALVRAIIAQQLSTHAASAIEKRVMALLPIAHNDWPNAITALSPDTLRQAGLSHAKIRTLKTLADHLSDQPGLLVQLANQTDHQVMQHLCQFRGIGPWTAEMFLMFGLQRMDVFSGGDLGLRKAIQQVYDLPERPSPNACVSRAELWKPHRTIAAWHLWRLVD